MRAPIEVFVEIRNGVPSDVRTSLATPGGIKVTIVQIDDGDTEKDSEEAEQLAAEACERCPNFEDW
jgi:hypothetical protein